MAAVVAVAVVVVLSVVVVVVLVSGRAAAAAVAAVAAGAVAVAVVGSCSGAGGGGGGRAGRGGGCVDGGPGGTVVSAALEDMYCEGTGDSIMTQRFTRHSVTRARISVFFLVDDIHSSSFNTGRAVVIGASTNFVVVDHVQLRTEAQTHGSAMLQSELAMSVIAAWLRHGPMRRFAVAFTWRQVNQKSEVIMFTYVAESPQQHQHGDTPEGQEVVLCKRFSNI